MLSHIEKVRAPYQQTLVEELAVAESLLYRRGNFNGSFEQILCDGMREVLDAEIALSPGFRWGTSVVPGEAIAMDRQLDQTCLTYPETYVRDIAVSELKLILNSVADNLFTPDPYFQQGGDMVRTGGPNYSCTPNAIMGQRLGDLQLASGKAIEADKTYRVAGWATVGRKSAGPPIWEVVADYLRDKKTVPVERLETPSLKGVATNPGTADYAGVIQ